MQHFLLIKRDGLARTGARLGAAESALALLNARVWPLWRRTPNRARVAAGDLVAVYLAGAGESRVVASASVERVGLWNRQVASAYPLMLDGEPTSVLHLVDVVVFEQGVDVRALLPRLSFVRPGLRKWGVHFTGGMRCLPAADFALLTGGAGNSSRRDGRNLTYVVPEPPARPFRRGDRVQTVDRDGSVMGEQLVTAVRNGSVRTDCGRSWSASGWWSDGTRAWPFPSIRLCSP